MKKIGLFLLLGVSLSCKGGETMRVKVQSV